jgi:hypothetical protein
MEDSLRIVPILINEEEDFDTRLICYSALEKLVERTLAIDLIRSLDTVKAELLNELLRLACELHLDLSKLKCYPQVRLQHEKLKHRWEFTGQFKSISFDDGDEEEMSSNAESAYFLY